MTKLQRHIGLVALTLYGVGDILGSGIYGLVGKAAGQMGNFVWLAFLFSFVVALVTALVYAALGARYPAAAGSSLVVWNAFRSPLAAFVVGLATLCSGLTSMAAASRVFAGYLHGLIPILPEDGGVIVFASLVAAIVFIGIGISIWVNTICTFVELSGLLLIIIAGLPYLGSVSLTDVSSIPSGSLTPSLILSGAVLTFFSFVGFEDILNVGEEVKDPETTLPKGLILALLIASSIYFLVSAVAVSVVPAAELAGSPQPLVEVIRKAWPWFPTHIFSVIAMFAVANTALLNFIMGSRLLYGLGKLGLAPKFLSHVNKRTKTPVNAIALVLVILLVLAFSGDVSQLARATSILLLVVFMGMHASLVRFQLADKKRHAWHLPWIVPIVGLVGAVAMLANVKLTDATIAGTMIAVILVLYFIRRPTVEQIEKFEAMAD